MNKAIVVIFSLLLLLGITNAIRIHFGSENSGHHGHSGQHGHGKPE